MSSVVHSVESVPSEKALKLPGFVRPLSGAEAAKRRWKHNLVSWSAVALRAATAWRSTPSLTRSGCAVLMYHRVCERPRTRYAPSYSVSPAKFRGQLTWLLNRGYQPLRLADLVATMRTGGQLKPKTFVVTFDDGYANNFTRAFPILKELGIPATLFVATAYLDSDQAFPFDDWMVGVDESLPAECWRPATVKQYHEMQASGLIELAAHTHTHADFRGDPAGLRRDLQLCLDILAERFETKHVAFSYPFGEPKAGFSAAELVDVVQELGCYCAMETGNRSVALGDGIFNIPRFDVAPGDTGWSLAAKIDGQLENLRSCFHSLRGARQ